MLSGSQVFVKIHRDETKSSAEVSKSRHSLPSVQTVGFGADVSRSRSVGTAGRSISVVKHFRGTSAISSRLVSERVEEPEAESESDDPAEELELEELSDTFYEPAGDSVDVIRKPDSIKDFYKFIELVHAPAGGRSVFLCEHIEVGSEDSQHSSSESTPSGARNSWTPATKAMRRRDSNRKTCILKVRRKDCLPATETEAWLAMQLRLLQSRRHPNVLLPRRILEDERAYYVEFDLVKVGQSLLHMILNEPSTTEKQLKKIVHGILCGLAFLHENGLCHRDLKPDNILLEWDTTGAEGLKKGVAPPVGWRSAKAGVENARCCPPFRSTRLRHDLRANVRIIDLDFVADLGEGKRGDVLPALCGTPGYMAPEAYLQFGGAQADLWGVGVLIFLWVTCQAPFHSACYEAIRGEEFLTRMSLRTLERLSEVTRETVMKIHWGGEVWTEMQRCRDFTRMMLSIDPESRGSDAGDVLRSARWLQSRQST